MSKREQLKQAKKRPEWALIRKLIQLFSLPLVKPILPGLCLLCLVFLAYIPAMRGGFIWDDDAYVSENPTLLTFNGLLDNWLGANPAYQYYPLTLTTFWIEYRLWGLNPLGYHIVNVLLHGINALLLLTLLRRLQIQGAWLAAALFALHPVQVESVAWVTERKNVLSLFFYLLSALTYLRFLGWQTNSHPPGKKQRADLSPKSSWNYALSLLFFLAALLSKTVTASLPIAILLILYWKRRRITWRDLRPLIPFFVFGLALGLFTAWYEKHIILAKGEEWGLTLLERCLLAGRILWFYAQKLLVPMNLIFCYPRWEISQAIWWQYLYPATALIVVFGLWALRRRLGLGALIATLFFALTLSPALGFFNVYPMRYSFVADHFQYHASIGLIVLLSAVLTKTAAIGERYVPHLRSVITILLLGALGLLSWRQGAMYENQEILWRVTIEKNPTAFIAYNNLAILLQKQGRLDEALPLAQRALKLRPDDPIMKHNLANALWLQGRYDEAVPLLKEVLKERPDLASAHFLLGSSLNMLGEVNLAEQSLKTAIKLNPNIRHAERELALLLASCGRFEEALLYYEKALAKEPHNAWLWFSAGEAFEALGKFDQAAAAYREALKEQPGLSEAKKRLQNLPPR